MIDDDAIVGIAEMRAYLSSADAMLPDSCVAKCHHQRSQPAENLPVR